MTQTQVYCLIQGGRATSAAAAGGDRLLKYWRARNFHGPKREKARAVAISHSPATLSVEALLFQTILWNLY